MTAFLSCQDESSRCIPHRANRSRPANKNTCCVCLCISTAKVTKWLARQPVTYPNRRRPGVTLAMWWLQNGLSRTLLVCRHTPPAIQRGARIKGRRLLYVESANRLINSQERLNPGAYPTRLAIALAPAKDFRQPAILKFMRRRRG